MWQRSQAVARTKAGSLCGYHEAYDTERSINEEARYPRTIVALGTGPEEWPSYPDKKSKT